MTALPSTVTITRHSTTASRVGRASARGVATGNRPVIPGRTAMVVGGANATATASAASRLLDATCTELIVRGAAPVQPQSNTLPRARLTPIAVAKTTSRTASRPATITAGMPALSNTAAVSSAMGRLTATAGIRTGGSSR
jgi:hypothetical protein